MMTIKALGKPRLWSPPALPSGARRGRTGLDVAASHDDHCGSGDVSIGLDGTFGQCRDIDASDSKFGSKLAFSSHVRRE